MIEKYNELHRSEAHTFFDFVMFGFFRVMCAPIIVALIVILNIAFAYRLGFVPPF